MGRGGAAHEAYIVRYNKHWPGHMPKNNSTATRCVEIKRSLQCVVIQLQLELLTCLLLYHVRWLHRTGTRLHAALPAADNRGDQGLQSTTC